MQNVNGAYFVPTDPQPSCVWAEGFNNEIVLPTH